MQNISPMMLPILINKLKKRIDNVNNDILKEYGLSKLHLLYLMLLLETEEGLTLKELSEHLGFDKANTSRAISQLIAKKYVQKKLQGELELKYKVELTEKGREISSVIWNQNQEANIELIGLFTPEELRVLFQIGSKLWQYLSD
ncbi:MarR family winged helix-turn-helix transcriptional regulator [Peptostreptococcaceae bacterium OttesenSCG-928-C18]|nr:MarR family winged helix-turn-helix transcriptional regulator [Peptostreptococcaceae bacterium OttesenSCG-928-C18]